MAKNVGWEAKSNHDGSYTVTVNGKQYFCADTHEFLHFVAALWNIAWAVEQEIKRPEMVDLPERGEHSGIAF